MELPVGSPWTEFCNNYVCVSVMISILLPVFFTSLHLNTSVIFGVFLLCCVIISLFSVLVLVHCTSLSFATLSIFMPTSQDSDYYYINIIPAPKRCTHVRMVTCTCHTNTTVRLKQCHIYATAVVIQNIAMHIIDYYCVLAAQL